MRALFLALSLLPVAALAQEVPASRLLVDADVSVDADVENDAALAEELVRVTEVAPKGASPAALTAAVGATGRLVDLQWERVAGAVSYVVYWSPDGAHWGLLASTPACAFADRDIVPGSTTWYRVTALDALGRESAPSQAVQVRPAVEVAARR